VWVSKTRMLKVFEVGNHVQYESCEVYSVGMTGFYGVIHAFHTPAIGLVIGPGASSSISKSTDQVIGMVG